MKKLQELLAKLRRDEKGATVIEYALIAALISVAAIAAFSFVGGSVNSVMTNVNSALNP
jgi:pilus assembly protein Flp/PilA